VDRNRQIIAGHGRYEAAKLAGYTQVPVIFLDHLTETQARAYMLADNKLTDRSTWDDSKIAIHLKELTDLALDFDIEAIGFELPEIDIRIQSLDQTDAADRADEFDLASEPAVSVAGDLWILGPIVSAAVARLKMAPTATCSTMRRPPRLLQIHPYNVAIDGHVSGNGRITHREFPMATGEMSEVEFTEFLTASLSLICAHTVAARWCTCAWTGATWWRCMLPAARQDAILLNLCVWSKSNGGLARFTVPATNSSSSSGMARKPI